MNTTYYNDVRRQVTRRLGYKNVLANLAIEIIWGECKFRQDYLLQKLSPWCSVCFI